VVKTQGRQGEVAADLSTDFPERFADRKQLYALATDGTRRALELESHWGHKGRVVLKFRGVDSISDAEVLVGCEIQIRRAARVELEPGSAYVSDLVGCAVTAVEAGRKRELGEIADVQFGAGEAPLLVIRSGKQELLVPFATEFLENIDLEHRRVAMKLPEGMLEVDAPLTDEEKRAQQGGRGDEVRGRGRLRDRR
jgi:16S rRNA processing protein RimM